MLSLVGKLLGVPPEDEEHHATAVNKDNASLEVGPAESRRYEAKVTSLHSDYGLIDGEIYFSYDAVSSGVMPKVGDSVLVTAKRKHGLGGWRAACVDPITDGENWDDPELEDFSEYTEELTEMKPPEPESPDSLVGLVRELNAEEALLDTGVGAITFSLEECEFSPEKGDWVTGKISDNENGKTIHDVKPLRVKDFTGNINSLQREFGYVDHEIYFSMKSSCQEYCPRRGDRVCGIAIECSRGKYSTPWRAISLEPYAEVKCNPSVANSSIVLGNPVLLKGTNDLLTNKNDLQISDSSEFGRIELGRPKRIELIVRNLGEEERFLQSCKYLVSGGATQFDIDLSELSDENDREAEHLQISIPPNGAIKLPLMCQARYLGKDQSLFVMEFGGFKIATRVSVDVFEPTLSDLDASNPFRSQGGFARYKTDKESDESWIVPGRKPDRIRANLKLPNKLGQYPVPNEIRRCILEGREVGTIAPDIEQEISLENYSDKFGALLHFEEIQAEVDIRNFDMQRVCFRPCGEYLSLHVPGLAEGRPSVIIGDRIIASDPGLKGHGPSHEGYVHEILKSDILLKFHQNFHSTYNEEDYDVEFTFNRTTIRRSHQSAQFASKLGKTVLFPENLVPKASQTKLLKGPKPKPVAFLSKAQNVLGVRKCPLSSKTPRQTDAYSFYNDKLNARQKSAVVRILHGQCRPTPYVLFGPPGTGKTITVVEAILQIFNKIPSSRIIACAPSNSAADLIAERLQSNDIIQRSDMIRLNAFQRGAMSIPESIEGFCSDGEDLELVARYRIIVCTCSTAGMLYALGLKTGHFTHAFIDEAGQATEPECMIPAGLVAPGDGQVVLAGDPRQLGPVLRSTLAKFYGMEMSLLERLTLRSAYTRNERSFADHGSYDPLLVTKLVENYRSHPALLDLSSRRFYDGELEVSADRNLVDCMCQWDVLPQPGFPLIFHGVRGDDLREENSPSWFNPQEVFQVSAYLKQIIENPICSLSFDDVGIIAPYRKQVEKIRFMIDKFGMEKVKVGSVEEFQGQERLVMIISTVRSNENLVGVDLKHNIGFLSNPKRFNVAITRAQALLIVIGNPYVLSQDENWLALLRYAVQNNAYVGCDPPDCVTDAEVEVEGAIEPTAEEGGPTEPPPTNPDISGTEIAFTISRCNLSSVTEVSESSMTDTSVNISSSLTPNRLHVDTTSDENAQSNICVNSMDPIEESDTNDKSDNNTMRDESADDSKMMNSVNLSTDGEISLSASYYSDDDGPVNTSAKTVSEKFSDYSDSLDSFRETNINDGTTRQESDDNQRFDTDWAKSTETLGSDHVCGNPSPSIDGNPSSSLSSGGNPSTLVSGNPPPSVCGNPSSPVGGNPSPSLSGNPSSPVGGNPSPSLSGNPSPSLSGNPSPSLSGNPSSPVGGNPSPSLSGNPSPSLSGNPSPSLSGNPSPPVDGDPSPTIVAGSLSEHPKAAVESSTEESSIEADALDDQPETLITELPVCDTAVELSNNTESLTLRDAAPAAELKPDFTDNDAENGTESETSANSSSEDQVNGKESEDGGGDVEPHRGWFLSEEWNVERTEKVEAVLAKSRESYEIYKKCRRPRERRERGNQYQRSRIPAEGHGKSANGLEKKIIRQIEYYFGDLNLIKDDFLQKEMDKDKDQWVNISVLIMFNRLQTLTKDVNVIAEAVRRSTSGLLEVHADGSKIRRSVARPLLKDHKKWKEELASRAIVLSMVPMRENIDVIQTTCELYGDVEHVEKDIWWKNLSGGRMNSTNLTLVVFSYPASVEKASMYPTVYRRKWKIHCQPEFVEETVDYFYDKRVQKLPKQSLVHVGLRKSNTEATSPRSATAKYVPAQSTPLKKDLTEGRQENFRVLSASASKDDMNRDRKPSGDVKVAQVAYAPDLPDNEYNSHRPVQYDRGYKLNRWKQAQQQSHSMKFADTESSARDPSGVVPGPRPQRLGSGRGRGNRYHHHHQEEEEEAGVGGHPGDYRGLSSSTLDSSHSVKHAESAASASYSSFIWSESGSLGVTALSSSVLEESSVDQRDGGQPLELNIPPPDMSAVMHSTPLAAREAPAWEEPRVRSFLNDSPSFLEQEDDDVIVESSEEEILED